MMITDSAKAYLENYLADKNKKGLVFEASGRACHTRLHISTTDEVSGSMINGLYIDMNEESAASLEAITIDMKDGHLVFVNNCASCHDSCQ